MQDLASVYAQSLFEVACEHDVLDEIRDQLEAFADELEGNREMRVYFFSPYFTSEEKKDGLHRTIEGADERFMHFLELLAERHRLPVIPRIRTEFDELWREERRLLPVSVTSAVELDEGTVEDIGKQIEEETGRTVELSSSVDAEIIGGLVIQVGNTIIDASVRGKLDRLRREVAAA